VRKKIKKIDRVSFPEDEERLPWLKLILDAYYIIDRGIAKAISRETQRGRRLACKRGCSNCCRTHRDIPVYPLEIKAISWYATGKIGGRTRETLIEQLNEFRNRPPCPFLVEDICSIHPVRPMACRQFNVFGKECDEGEDPYYTRREDVLDPVKEYVDQAFFMMLPYYGIKSEAERKRIIERGGFHSLVKELHACNWRQLGAIMRERR